jgi:hypothetical protein
MTEFNLNHLSRNPRIRSCEIQGVKYFSIIDFLAELRETDYHTAQTYYHVVKYRMRKNGVVIPKLKQIKSRAVDKKLRFSDFTTQIGISTLVNYLTPNLQKEEYRLNVRQDDEVVNFHPQIIAFFESQGWQVAHHVKLAFGSQIDIVATISQGIMKGIFIVECKPRLPRNKFYAAAGQVLCYWAEYGKASVPVIATHSSQIEDYIEICCQSLGIRLLAVDLLEDTTIYYDVTIGYDLVTEKPLLMKNPNH